MLGLACVAGAAHVPTYGGGVENCFVPPHKHTTSQAIYLKGSGGLEIHCSETECPFSDGEVIDVDAVFRDRVDQTTFDLYIGCGGCVASADPIVIEPVKLEGYQPAVLEAFTQTRYSSALPKHLRRYDTNGVRTSAGCDQGHFTIRLVDYGNRTGLHRGPIVWSAVVGLAEEFTLVELLSYPIFVLRNHGDTWNESGWTIWVVVFILTPLCIWVWRWCLFASGITAQRPILYVLQCTNARVTFYAIASFAFVAAALEELVHLNIASQGVHTSSSFFVSLFLVILFSNGLPLWQVWSAWTALEYEQRDDDANWHWNGYWEFCKSPWWTPVEFVTGVSYLFLFGAGFFVGPTCICLAAVARALQLLKLLTKSDEPTAPPSKRHDTPALLLAT